MVSYGLTRCGGTGCGPLLTGRAHGPSSGEAGAAAPAVVGERLAMASGQDDPRHVDPHRDDTEVFRDVHAVEHESHEVKPGEIAREQLRERVLGRLDEAARDRRAGLAVRCGLDLLTDGLEAR